MPEAVIVDAVRTPIGRAVKGSLKDVRADDLASIPLRALKERRAAQPRSTPRASRRFKRSTRRGSSRARSR